MSLSPFLYPGVLPFNLPGQGFHNTFLTPALLAVHPEDHIIEVGLLATSSTPIIIHLQVHTLHACFHDTLRTPDRPGWRANNCGQDTLPITSLALYPGQPENLLPFRYLFFFHHTTLTFAFLVEKPGIAPVPLVLRTFSLYRSAAAQVCTHVSARLSKCPEQGLNLPPPAPRGLLGDSSVDRASPILSANQRLLRRKTKK